MAELIVQVTERQQGFDPLQPRLADADQDAAGEGDSLATGLRHRGNPDFRRFVG